MIEIALHPEGILQKDISVNQSISTKYLDQIIASLKASGLIKRVAGKRSGYILAKTTEEISVYDIYKAFEHELNVGDCPTKTSECVLIGQCEIQNYWCDLNTAISNHMRRKTLANILTEK